MLGISSSLGRWPACQGNGGVSRCCRCSAFLGEPRQLGNRLVQASPWRLGPTAQAVSAKLTHARSTVACNRAGSLARFRAKAAGTRPTRIEHHQTHALLTVIGAVEEAHQRAGEHQHAANPERGHASPYRGTGRDPCGERETSRSSKRDPAPMKPTKGESSRAAPTSWALCQLMPLVQPYPFIDRIGHAHAHDRADHGVGTGGGQSQEPGADVPDNGGDEQGKNHRETRAGTGMEHQFHRQQGDDAVSDRARRPEHAEQIPATRPDHGIVGLEGVCVDDRRHRVRGIVESVDEFETQGQAQGQ